MALEPHAPIQPIRSKSIREDLKPENGFSDFELPDQDGQSAKLSMLMAGRPTVLNSDRGNY
ncbi:MAG: hypothetical protein O7G32_10275 [SAR324 cluster bacterium]|nr:hypothetical protein [SAR324 cluster bacterium]